MFGPTRWNPFDEIVSVHREVDRLFHQFFNASQGHRPGAGSTWSPFQVSASADGWKVQVPLPGIDPQHVTLEAAGHTLTIRAQEPGADDRPPTLRYEQTVTVPPFLDLENVTATHRHGLLELTLPLQESVKPRRIAIDVTPDEPKKLTAAA